MNVLSIETRYVPLSIGLVFITCKDEIRKRLSVLRDFINSTTMPRRYNHEQSVYLVGTIRDLFHNSTPEFVQNK